MIHYQLYLRLEQFCVRNLLKSQTSGLSVIEMFYRDTDRLAVKWDSDGESNSDSISDSDSHTESDTNTALL